METAENLDSPQRIHFIRTQIERKKALKQWYLERYHDFKRVVDLCPAQGTILEIGSGGGFLSEVVPQVKTSDVLAYEGVDLQVDATRMPFEANTLRAIFMLNVFHHIPDVEAFLRECDRCLIPGGRVLIVDQYPGFPGKFIYRYAHHEPFDCRAADWKFESSGPLSSANGALAWIVFERDRRRFESLFPRLRIDRLETHSPLRYWMSGGLKNWNLLPGSLFRAASTVDSALTRLSPKMGSFVNIELGKKIRRPRSLNPNRACGERVI